MRSSIRAALAAAVFATAGLCASEPARADNWSIRISGGGIGFSYDSGGYCDAWGCPDDYWDYPIYYCPVYYRAHWYSGPVYYRRYHGVTWFWIRGGWHREDLDGARPGWACLDRFGPALDLFFYESRGFRVRDDWRRQWERDHGWDWDRGRNEWRHRHNDWNNNKGHDRDRDSDWQKNGGWTRDRHDWNRFDDNDRKHGRNSDDTFRQLLERDKDDNKDKKDDRDSNKGGRNDQGWNNPFSPGGDEKNNDGNKRGDNGDKPKHNDKAQNDQSGFNPFAPSDTGGNRNGNGDKPKHDKSQDDQGSSNPFASGDGGRNGDKPRHDKSQNDQGNNGGQNNFGGQTNNPPPATTNPWTPPAPQNNDDGSRRHRGEPQ